MVLRKTSPVDCRRYGASDGASLLALAGNEQRIRNVARLRHLDAKHLLHTGAHLDHLRGAREVKEAVHGDMGLHENDLSLSLREQTDHQPVIEASL